MEKVCVHCQAQFNFTAEDDALLQKLLPTINGQVYTLPKPTRCPDCRSQQRLATGNQLFLSMRTCDYTGESIMSHYPKDSKYTVYSQDKWHLEPWEARDYGRDYDFNRPFFEQFKDLMLAVPHPALLTDFLFDQNCSYTNHAGHNKDCYLIFDSDDCEDCYLSYSVHKCKDCLDCFRLRECELCTECVDCYDCYGCKYCQDSSNCSDSAFLKDCVGCRHCLFCSNLQSKEYCIFNKQVSKEEFEAAWSKLSSRQYCLEQQKIFKDWHMQFPKRAFHGVNNEDVSGDYIDSSKNSHGCFDSSKQWDCRHCCQAWDGLKDSMDTQECGLSEFLYETAYMGENCQNTYFTCLSPGGCLYNVFYSMYCIHGKNLFGCFGMRKSEYCILNKQYTEAEYNELVPRIIQHMMQTGEWGEFFPIDTSPFFYNETLAQDHYPLTKSETLSRGWPWQDPVEEQLEFTKSINAQQLPDTIADIPDDVLNWVIVPRDGKPFKIVSQELALRRTMNAALPLEPFLSRYHRWRAMRNERVLYHRQCQHCSKDIQTTYAPNRPEIVYCEECYLKEVY